MGHILLIEDDELLLLLLSKQLRAAGMRVSCRKDGRGLNEELKLIRPDLVIVDLGLPYMDGFALLENLRGSGFKVPVVVISAYEVEHLEDAAKAAGANAFLGKPFAQDQMIETVNRLLAA